MSESKLAAAIICLGNEEDAINLRRCLESITPYVDGVFVTITGAKEDALSTIAVCEEFKVNISYTLPYYTVTKESVEQLTDILGYAPHMQVGDSLFLFDQARNFNFSQIPKEYEWILWIDSDDVLKKGENLWKLKTIGDQSDVDVFFLKYVYLANLDEKGEVKESLIEHIRERVVRNNGNLKWVAPIHEVLVETRVATKASLDDCFILHMITRKDINSSIQRNMKLLEYAFYLCKGEDPRHIYNLAKGYIDLRKPEYDDKAFPLLKAFLWGPYQSEWPAERAEAYELLCDYYRKKGEFNNAVKACMLSLIEDPEKKSTYFNLAAAYVDREDWDKALFWVHLADKVVEKATTLTKMPRDLQVARLSTIYTASLNKGKTYDAFDAAVKLKELAPNSEAIQACYDFISRQKEQRDVASTVVALINYLKSTGEEDKILSILGSLPLIIKDDVQIAAIKGEFLAQR